MSFRKPCHMPSRKLIQPFTLTVNMLTQRNDARNNKLTEQKKAVFVFLKTLRTFGVGFTEV